MALIDYQVFERMLSWMTSMTSAFHSWEAMIHLVMYEHLKEKPEVRVGVGHEFSFGPLGYSQFLKNLGRDKRSSG